MNLHNIQLKAWLLSVEGKHFMASEQEVSESLSSDATFHVASKNSITFTFRVNDCDASSFPSVAKEVFV